jgi:hypothetical protein
MSRERGVEGNDGKARFDDVRDAMQLGHAPKRMGRMMMGGGDLDLKGVSPEERVRAISYCRDTFRVTTTAEAS